MSKQLIQALTIASAPFRFYAAEVNGRPRCELRNANACINQPFTMLDNLMEKAGTVFNFNARLKTEANKLYLLLENVAGDT